MLKKVTMKNYRSFLKKTTIDLEATNYQRLLNTNVYNGIVKGLIFVGGNGTGKTNALFAIRFLLDLLFKNVNFSRECCLFSVNDEMSFEYEFVQDDDNISYYILLSRYGKVLKERLILNDDIILNRLLASCETTLSDKKNYEKEDIDDGTLFLKTLYFYTKFSSNTKIQKWYSFLQNSVYYNLAERELIMYNDRGPNLKIKNYLKEFGKDKINEFYKSFGFDQELDFEKEHFINDRILLEFTSKEDAEYKEIFVKRNNIDLWIPYSFESLGNRTLLNLLPVLFYSLENNGMLIIDEFSSAFHNQLEELVIKYFMEQSKTSQMFFVTHSTNLLKSTLFRPDQIYTVKFDDESGSKIFRVSHQHPRESQNFERMYLNNIFDGLPKYND